MAVILERSEIRCQPHQETKLKAGGPVQYSPPHSKVLLQKDSMVFEFIAAINSHLPFSFLGSVQPKCFLSSLTTKNCVSRLNSVEAASS